MARKKKNHKTNQPPRREVVAQAGRSSQPRSRGGSYKGKSAGKSAPTKRTGAGGTQRRTATRTSSRTTSPMELFRYVPGAPITTNGTSNRYNKIQHYKGWVYVAVRAIAEKVSQLRPTVGITRPVVAGKSKWLTNSTRTRLKATSMIQEHEDIEPVDEGHPLDDLLNNPNDPDTCADLWYKTILYWELTGVCYWWLIRNNAGIPCEIWVLPSHWVTPIGGTDRLIDKYLVTPYEGSYNSTYIDADDIITIKHPSPLSMVDGWSALDGGSAWVDQADAMDSARWFQMQNAHNAGLVLQLGGDLETPGKEDLDAAYAMLGERMRGPSKNRLPLILPPGWESGGRFGMTSEELDFTMSFDQIRDMVLALFRVPKGVLGIEPGVANTSAYAPNAFFFDQCINPKLQFLSQVLSEKLAKRNFDEKLCVYWHNVAPLDPVAEQQKWDNALKSGAVTYNEYRTGYLNMQALEGFGDEVLIPSGLVPVPTGDTGVGPLLNWEQPKQIEAVEEEVVAPEEETVAPASIYPTSKTLRKSAVPDDAIKVSMPDVRQETSYSCILPGQELQGRVIGGSEAWYVGNAVEVTTASGVTLSVTMNHPVMTKEGFVPAGQLKKGQNLLHYVGEDDGVFVGGNEKHAPSIVEKVFKTLSSLSDVVSAAKSVGAFDFHGDAKFFNGKVNVVGSYCKLPSNFITNALNRIANGSLVCSSSQQFSLDSRGGSEAGIKTSLASSGGIVGGGGLHGSCAGVHAAPNNLASISPTSDLYASGSDFSFYDTVGVAKFPTEGLNGLASDVPFDNQFNAGDILSTPLGSNDQGLMPAISPCRVSPFKTTYFGAASNLDASLYEFSLNGLTADSKLASDLVHRSARDVVLDEIVDVRYFHYEGPVYDFESPLGFIVVNKLCISNCGAAAFQAIAEMYGVGPQEESWYRDALDTDPESGTPPANIRELADNLGLQSVAKTMTADEVKGWLDKGTPVILLIQAWGDASAYAATNDNGHYVVAIGYTDDELIVEDPSLRLIRGWIAWDDLEKRWHDTGMDGESYDHWGMAVVKHEVMREVKAVVAEKHSSCSSFSLNGNAHHIPKVGQKGW